MQGTDWSFKFCFILIRKACPALLGFLMLGHWSKRTHLCLWFFMGVYRLLSWSTGLSSVRDTAPSFTYTLELRRSPLRYCLFFIQELSVRLWAVPNVLANYWFASKIQPLRPLRNLNLTYFLLILLRNKVSQTINQQPNGHLKSRYLWSNSSVIAACFLWRLRSCCLAVWSSEIEIFFTQLTLTEGNRPVSIVVHLWCLCQIFSAHIWVDSQCFKFWNYKKRPNLTQNTTLVVCKKWYTLSSCNWMTSITDWQEEVVASLLGIRRRMVKQL